MEEVIVTATIFGLIVYGIVYVILIIPWWVWYAIVGVIIFIILCSVFSGSSQTSSSSGDYSSSCGGGGSASSDDKEERGEWPFNERVVIEGGKVSDKGAFGSGILSRQVGRAEKRGGAFEYDHVRISKGTFGNEKVAEIRGDKVYDSHGNKVGEVRHGFFGKTIVDKNGKEIGELKD